MHIIHCPKCNQKYELEESIVGCKVQCAVCNEEFIAQIPNKLEGIQISTNDSGNLSDEARSNIFIYEHYRTKRKFSRGIFLISSFFVLSVAVIVFIIGTKYVRNHQQKTNSTERNLKKTEKEITRDSERGFEYYIMGSRWGELQGTYLLSKAPDSIVEYDIPEGVTRIGGNGRLFDQKYAFSDCIHLKRITIPKTVKEISYHAFYNCKSLTEIVIPDSVSFIGDHAFQGCENLQTIKLSNNLTSIEDALFSGCKSLEKISLPNGIKEIPAAAFYNCSSLKHITIPNGIMIIRGRKPIELQNTAVHWDEIYGAFENCSSLKEISIPNSVIEIQKDAFKGTACESQLKRDYPHLFEQEGKYVQIDPHNILHVNLANGITFEMVKIEASNFEMSAIDGDNSKDEIPHQAKLTQDFYLSRTEVTQAQWNTLMNSKLLLSTNEKGDSLPAEVLWHDAVEYCNKLNEIGKAPDGWKFTLPTETQWEFAARGGKKSRGYKYSGSNVLDEVAWYAGNSWVRNSYPRHPVGKKYANELGLYDMSGNALEWCLDEYTDDSSKAIPELNQNFSTEKTLNRVARGGSAGAYTKGCRSSVRYEQRGDFWYSGIRLALVPSPKQ